MEKKSEEKQLKQSQKRMHPKNRKSIWGRRKDPVWLISPIRRRGIGVHGFSLKEVTGQDVFMVKVRLQ